MARGPSGLAAKRNHRTKTESGLQANSNSISELGSRNSDLNVGLRSFSYGPQGCSRHPLVTGFRSFVYRVQIKIPFPDKSGRL